MHGRVLLVYEGLSRDRDEKTVIAFHPHSPD